MFSPKLVMLKYIDMKILKSKNISPFGGVNFVIEELDKKRIGNILNDKLPKLGAQSRYDWRDILYSFWSVYFCGGDCAEDLSGNFKPSLSQSPNIHVPSPDRILNRLKELTLPAQHFSTKRGKHLHQFAINEGLTKLNLNILNHLFNLSKTKVDLDYDNTICFNKKQDAQYTYHKDTGYIPGVGLVGSKVVYVENRNGRSNAAILQHDTLERMFEHLKKEDIQVNRFRADSASYTFEIIKVIANYSDKFYIKARMSHDLASAIALVEKWEPVGNKENDIYRGETFYTPFKRAAEDHKAKKEDLKTYRFIVTKEKRKDGQVNAFTKEAFQYSVIITSDEDSDLNDVVFYYNQRGTIEKEFDVLKNDFGWNKLPFSTLEHNMVYLQIMAICRNLYHYIINRFSERFEGLRPTFRIKKFIFRFIAIPSKWVYKSRQWHLRIYGDLPLKI